ncbi:winged helix-turn-helix domain-containing protein [Pseudoalteromonas rhizosphaerae]|uniref:Winged helix-turn-helix domain-containing protein n=1 Tax=Pseudoalteromonas rhizosphaerae TaxID=2518973 RepID=A0ABW8L372_9GAMM
MESRKGIMLYTFNEHSFDPLTGIIFSTDESIQLRPKLALLLEYFLRNAGRVITRDELLSTLWVNGEYRESSLTQSIRELRKQLNDNVQSPTYIKTLPQRGYLWICETHISESRVIKSKNIEQKKYFYNNSLVYFKKHYHLLIILFTVICLLTFFFAKEKITLASASQSSHPVRLIIAPFKNLTGENKFDWFNYGLRYLLIQNINNSGVLAVIPDEPSYHLLSLESEEHNNLSETLHSLINQGHAERWLEVTVSQESGLFVFNYILSNATRVIKKGVIYSDDLMDPLPNLAAVFTAQIIGESNMISTYHVSENDSSTKDYLEGLYALETKGAKLALHYFEASLLHDPNNLHASIELARIYWQTGRLKQASKVFFKLSDNYQLSLKPLLQVRMLEYWGEFKLAQGEYAKAQSLLERALVANDKIDNDVLASKIYRKQASIAWQQHRWDEYNSLIDKTKNLFEAHMLTESEAQRLYYIGNPPSVRPEIDQTINLQEGLDSLYKSISYYSERGNSRLLMKSYFALGQNYLAPLEKRERALMIALALASEQQEHFYQTKIANYLGFYFIQLHQGDKALKYINIAEETLSKDFYIAPLYYRNQLLLGMAKMDIGIANNDRTVLELAQQTFNNLLTKLDSSDNYQDIKADAYLLKGWTLLALNNELQAVTSLQHSYELYKTLKMKDSVSYSVYSLMYAHLMLKDYEVAITLAKSESFDKKLIHDYSAFAFFKLNNTNAAVEELTKIKNKFTNYWNEEEQLRYELLLLNGKKSSQLDTWFEKLQKPYTVYCESEWNMHTKLIK